VRGITNRVVWTHGALGGPPRGATLVYSSASKPRGTCLSAKWFEAQTRTVAPDASIVARARRAPRALGPVTTAPERGALA
jgi:hypothetical protein